MASVSCPVQASDPLVTSLRVAGPVLGQDCAFVAVDSSTALSMSLYDPPAVVIRVSLRMADKAGNALLGALPVCLQVDLLVPRDS